MRSRVTIFHQGDFRVFNNILQLLNDFYFRMNHWTLYICFKAQLLTLIIYSIIFILLQPCALCNIYAYYV